MELSQGHTGFYPVYGIIRITGTGYSPGCAAVAAPPSGGKKAVESYLE
ncbi:hypothetical protein Xmir_02995 [Xenorhabdus miraniensis]|uniref:Uncharacterized protein n=1 Tax=Xenorhabdus miraniensis TaxID=351674 RepID=A0A2D0JMW2_9GAMM|nr:hypothetical protein Xmir_02995 [Xenorhabdus miraniensis]